MTHNVYFHREVTYNSRRPATSSLNEEAFWCVRKATASTVERFDHNPVKSTYELLWAEMKRQDSFLPGLQNAMRRILETYFKILGRMSDDDIVGKFEGKEIVLCRSLLSWTNAGSHHVYDDLQVLESSGDSSAFRNVFKRIFEVSGHEAHYTMMMNGAAAASPGDQIHASPASS
jgi:wobble nucleotide-excising tRNase